MSKHVLCAVDALQENETKAFEIEDGEQTVSLFVMQRDGQWFAYKNNCPHTGAPLNWQPDEFLDMDGFFIQCAVHGALFQVEDGLCVRGPCINQSLTSLPTSIDEGSLVVEIV